MKGSGRKRWGFDGLGTSNERLSSRRQLGYGCTMKSSIWLLTVVMLAAAVAGLDPLQPARGAETGGPFEWSELTIVTAQGNRHRFRVEIVATSGDRAQGLQGRQRLEPDAGMLFAYATPEPVIMWMKNTFIPLDMIFIGADGRIVNIAPDTEPQSLAFIESAGPVKGVLEVRAGTAARLGIRKGDRVLHRSFE